MFNGCIYNYQELREELRSRGIPFFSTADSEVILKAFHHWGRDCVEHLIGMFAFAIVDRDTGDVTLARDRLGHQAAVPGRDAGPAAVRIVHARAGRAGGVDTSIDRYALHHYMTFPLRGTRAAHHLRGHQQVAAGDRAGDRARRDQHRKAVLGARFPSTRRRRAGRRTTGRTR